MAMAMAMAMARKVFSMTPMILTISLHANPARFYPCFQSHAHEQGTASGYNLNLPLERGSDNEAFLAMREMALARVCAFRTDAIVITLEAQWFA